MNRKSPTICLSLSIVAGTLLAAIGAAATPPGAAKEGSTDQRPAAPLPTVEEARGRAKLLGETFEGMLRVVHHEYYREDEKLPIPARTFKKVFRELAKQQKYSSLIDRTPPCSTTPLKSQSGSVIVIPVVSSLASSTVSFQLSSQWKEANFFLP